MRNPTKLLKDAAGLFLDRPLLFLGITAFPMALATIVELLFPNGESGIVSPTMGLTYMFLVLVLVVAQIIMYIALILAANNGTLSIANAYSHAVTHFWRYIVVSLIAAVMIMLGFVFFIIPGIILLVWFAFSGYILVLENGGIIESLKRSREYVRGKWWKVAGRLLVLIAVVIITSFLVRFLVGSVFALVTGGAQSALLGSLATLLATLFVHPYSVIYTYLMYQDVKAPAAAIE